MRETILAKKSLHVVCFGFLLPLLTLHQAKESLAFSTDRKIISIVGIPLHERDNLGKEKLARCLFWLSLALAHTAPGKRVPCILYAWTQCHNLGVPIYQH